MVATLGLSLWIIVVGLIIAAGGTLVLAVYAATDSDGDQALQAFAVLLLSVFLWTVGQALQLLSASLGWKILWQGVLYIGIVFTPVTWFLFTVIYTGRTSFVRRRTVVALAVPSGLTLLLLYTNRFQPLSYGFHHFYYESVSLVYVGETPILTTTAGELWWLWFGYSYLLIGLGFVLLVRFALTAESLYRVQVAGFVIASLLPLGVNAVYVFDLIGNPVIDLTPLAFSMSMLLLFVAVFYGRFLDLVPVAHETVVRTLEDGIFVVDQSGRIVSANPAAATTVTGSTDPDAVVGEELSALEPTLAVSAERGRTTSNSGVVRGYEVSQVTGGGTEWYWVRRVDLSTRTTGGGSIVTLTDITDKKRFERQLRKLQQTHQELIVAEDEAEIANIAVESSREVLDLPITGIWKVDERQQVLEPITMTEPAVDMFGTQPPLGPDDLIWEAVSDDELKVYTDLQQETNVHNPETPIQSELHIPVGDWGVISSGSTTQTEFHDTDFDLLRLLATAVERAIKRRRRERRIRDLHQKTSELMRAQSSQEIADLTVEAATDVLEMPLSGIHLVDDEEMELEPAAVTPAIHSVFDTPPCYRRDANSETDQTIWDVFETGETLSVGDVAETDIDSVGSPIRSIIAASLGGHGVFITSSPKPYGVDETDRALVELFATTVTAALDRVEREQELRDRERELSRQNNRLDEFTSVVSHDLRSPLNQVNINLELLSSEYDDDRLESAARANKRARDMIDDLLRLARQGKTVEDTEEVSLNEIVCEAWQSVPSREMTLETDTDVDTVLADGGRLREAFENLFRNAVEHGGSTVSFGELEDENGVYVADDGAGIPADQWEDIFEQGYTTATDGTGFGLAIVERIVEAHGWQIRVTEAPSGGARFEITEIYPDVEEQTGTSDRPS